MIINRATVRTGAYQTIFGNTRYTYSVHIGWMGRFVKDWTCTGFKTEAVAETKGQKALVKELNRLKRHGNSVCLLPELRSNETRPNLPVQQ